MVAKNQRGGHELGEPVVVVEGVEKAFGAFPVLKNVSLTIRRGETVCIIGPSGSGKSTLLRCINALVPISNGSITVAGRQVNDPALDKRALRRDVGIVFQQYNLFPHKTALQNVMMAPIHVLKQDRVEVEERAKHLLAKVGLSHKHDAYPGELSGGQQQRVAIARALAMEPAVVLFDEPTSALDPRLVRDVATLLRALDDLKKTLVVVSHDMDFARAIADQAIYFEGGRAVETGTASAVFGHPSQPETKAFMDSFHAGRVGVGA